MFILLVAFSFFLIRPFLLSLFLGALITYIFYPLYKLFLQKTKRPTLSALLICLLVFVLLIIPTAFFVDTLVKETYVLYILVKQKLAAGLFHDCTNSFCEALKGLGKNPGINSQVQNIIKAVTTWFVEKSSQLLISLPRIALNLLVMFFTMFYFLKDGELFLKRINVYLSLHQKKYELLLGRLKEIIHGIVYGYLIVALIQGALGALGFFIFGVSSPLFWGLVMALLALIPCLGTGLVWAPAAVFLFLEGIFQDSNWLMVKGVALFVYGLLVVGGIDNILKPKLIGEKARIPPVIVMVGIFGGLLVVGPLGVIIGPLVLSLTAVIVETFLGQNEEKT